MLQFHRAPLNDHSHDEDMPNYRRIFKILNSDPDRTELTDQEGNAIENKREIGKLYSNWPSNDYGDDMTLYCFYDHKEKATRYLLFHHEREWFGGWTINDTLKWYVISRGTFVKLCRLIGIFSFDLWKDRRKRNG